MLCQRVWGTCSGTSAEPHPLLSAGPLKDFQASLVSAVSPLPLLLEESDLYTLCLCFTASGHPHCFFCHLELGSDQEVPSSFANHVNVEFSMPTTSASKAAVRSISVEDKTDVRKWVNYSAHYSYKVAWGGIWLMSLSPFVHPCHHPCLLPFCSTCPECKVFSYHLGGRLPCYIAVDESALI